MKLLALGCCATKRKDAGILPAIERYDGPMWQTLRARLTELPDARAALHSGDLVIMFLSAQFGFQEASMPIPDYERQMTPARAIELCTIPTGNHATFADRFAQATEVMFAAGDMYRQAMWRASRGRLSDIMRIAETDGLGIGHHRAELSAWLIRHFGPG